MIRCVIYFLANVDNYLQDRFSLRSDSLLVLSRFLNIINVKNLCFLENCRLSSAPKQSINILTIEKE